MITEASFLTKAKERGLELHTMPRSHAAGFGLHDSQHMEVYWLKPGEVEQLIGVVPTVMDPIITRCKCGAYMVG